MLKFLNSNFKYKTHKINKNNNRCLKFRNLKKMVMRSLKKILKLNNKIQTVNNNSQKI